MSTKKAVDAYCKSDLAKLCYTCKKTTKWSCTLDFTCLPEVLMIAANPGTLPVAARIDPQFVLEERPSGAAATERTYTLFGLVVRSADPGTPDSGHYFAYVLCGGVWYKFDDEAVTRANNEAEVLSQRPRLMFYAQA